MVTNTGNAALTGVDVSDDQNVTVACPKTSLDAGEAMTCTAAGRAVAGHYANVGTVRAKDPLANPVSDTDPSHYFGSDPGIDVEKATNLQDADLAPGPLVAVGSQVTWTYVVANSGPDPLSDVAVVDDREGPVSCPATTLAPKGQSGDSMTCTAKTGTATAGQYENSATATGTDPARAKVADSDPSHYFGAEPKIDLEKSTNGQDADAAPGPYVPVGNKVAWNYKVTNTGNVPLTLGSPIVTDDKVTAIVCPKLLILNPGQVVTCAAVGKAQAGQYANEGSVSATDPLGLVVSDKDPSHYVGSDPSIDIEKLTNGDNADLAPGRYIPVGDPVNWTYVVTNTGNVELTDVSVVDLPTDPADRECRW